MPLTTNGQWGPEALLDTDTGRPITDGTITVPAGYAFTFTDGNLTITGPPGPVTFTVTRGGVPQSFTVNVDPAVSELAEVADKARAALPSATASGTYVAYDGSEFTVGGVPVEVGGGGTGQTAPGNVIVAVGDSITSFNSGAIIEFMSQGWYNHLHVRSRGRLRFGGVYATAGFTIQQIEATHLPSVLALDPAPAACFVFAGSNDTSANGGVGFGLTTEAATLKAICAALLDKGILPILVLIPPNASSSTIQANVALWNTYVGRLAQRGSSDGTIPAGLPLLDAFTPLVDPATGGIRAELATDTVHPNAAGHKAIAEYNLDRLTPWFPPTKNHHALWADPTNLVTSGEGLFRTDTNADGVANGWSVGGGAAGFTASLVPPTLGDDLVGQWQQIATTSTSTPGWLFRQIAAGWSAGDRLELSARMQTEGLAGGGGSSQGVHLYARCTSPNTTWGLVDWRSDVADGELTFSFDMPTGAANLFLYLQFGRPDTVGRTCEYRYGQVTLRNLTTNGLVTL